MKMKYLISFLVICLVSLGSIVILLQTGVAEAFNRDFKLEILLGDTSIFDKFQFSNLIQEAPNRFTQVTLTSGEPLFEPTIFDQTHHLNAQQLAHREVYRGISSFIRGNFENDEVKVVYGFDNHVWQASRDSTIRVNILNKQTGDISRINYVLNDSAIDLRQVWNVFLVENAGGLYLVLPEDGILSFMVYAVDTQNMRLEYEFSFNNGQGLISTEHSSGLFGGSTSTTIAVLDGTRWGSWHATAKDVYFNLGMNPDANDDEPFSELYRVDFASQSVELVTVAGDFVGLIGGFADLLVTETQVLAEETGEWLDAIAVANLQTGEVTPLMNPFMAEHAADFNSRRGWWQSHSIVGNYLVLNYRPDTLQLVAIYDLTTLELVLMGRIRLRQDQGLMPSGGWFRGFDVTLRD